MNKSDVTGADSTGPAKVMISATDSCNLRCKTCWRLEKEEDPNLNSDKELSLDKIKEILHDCKKLNVKTIDLTGGGEAFIRRDIFEIIRLSKSYGFFTSVTTNGTLLTEEGVQKLIDLKLDDLCFSLESCDEKTNDFIRGQGVLKSVVSTIKIVNELKKNASSPSMRISTVITRANYENLYSLADFCRQQKITGINFSVLMEWKTNREFSMSGVDYQDTLSKLGSLLDKAKIHHNLMAILKYGLFEHPHPSLCRAPWEISFINSSGDVLACCTLASHYENILGNVKDERFYDIWFGKKMDELRERMKRKEFFKECSRCLPDITAAYNIIQNRTTK
jgi:radical SAM protein with 4Fe4S-binding SPASM domain